MSSSKRRFTLRTLLVLIAIGCGILSLFYPRSSYEVSVKIPLHKDTLYLQQDPIQFRELMASEEIVDRMLKRFPEVGVYLASERDPGQFLKEQVKITSIDDETILFRATGRPTERGKIKVIVDAVADTIVDYYRENISFAANKLTRVLTEAKSELDSQVEQATGAEQDDMNRLRDTISDQIEELVSKKSVKMPKVIKREGGVDF